MKKKLLLDEKNANRGTDRGRAMVEASLREVGAGRSVVTDKAGRLIAGNKTYAAAAEIGLELEIVHSDGKRLLVVQRDDLDLSDDAGPARRLALLDNRASEIGLAWDAEQLLASLNDGLSFEGIFDQAELDALLAGLRKVDPVVDPGADLSKADELQAKWKVKTGDLWQLGKHRLACGDCTDAATVARLMGGERADACISDPPYGIGFDTDYTRFTIQSGKNNKYGPIENDDRPFDPTPFLDFDSVVLWGANYYADKLPRGTWLIWDKRFANGEAWLSDGEIAWMKGGTGVYIFSLTSQGFVRPEPVQHPTQKAVALMAWCIEKSKAGLLIYDPFSGSGTTLIACEQLSRQCRAIEISPAYVAVALERWSIATNQTPALLSDSA